MIGWDWSLRLPLSGAHKMGMLGISAAEKQKRKGISDSQFEESRSNLGPYELVQGNKNQPEPSPFLRIVIFWGLGKVYEALTPSFPTTSPFTLTSSANSFQQGGIWENSLPYLRHGKIWGCPTNSISCVGQVSASVESLLPFVHEQRG